MGFNSRFKGLNQLQLNQWNSINITNCNNILWIHGLVGQWSTRFSELNFLHPFMFIAVFLSYNFPAELAALLLVQTTECVQPVSAKSSVDPLIFLCCQNFQVSLDYVFFLFDTLFLSKLPVLADLMYCCFSLSLSLSLSTCWIIYFLLLSPFLHVSHCSEKKSHLLFAVISLPD